MPDHTKKKLRMRLAQAAADAAADKARKKALADFDISPEELDAAMKPKPAPRAQVIGNVAPPAPGETTPAAGEKLDLIAWAKGEVKYPFFTVRKAFAEQYSYDGMQTREDGCNFLEDNGLLAPGEAKP